MTKRCWSCLLVLLIFIGSCSTVTTLSFTEQDVKDSPNLVKNNSFSPYSTIGEESFKGLDGYS